MWPVSSGAMGRPNMELAFSETSSHLAVGETYQRAGFTSCLVCI